jgi:c-di-GMP phosphodiesterase
MDIVLARRPVFDRQESVVAYELTYSDPVAAGGGSREHLVVEAVLGLGLEALTGGTTAYLPLSENLLLQEAVELLEPGSVLILLDGAALSKGTIEACRRLREKGYRFGLDRYLPTPATEPLLDLFEVIKVDVRLHSREYLTRSVERLRPHRPCLLAEGVESAGMRDLCLALGFELFQGYRFATPEVVSRRDLPVEYAQAFLLLNQLRDPDTPDAVVEETFRRDANLTYKLLRIVNSAAVGGREFRSVGQAIRLLGRQALVRWLSLLLLSSVREGNVKSEAATAALIRARMCELLAPRVQRPRDGGALFLVGLFSLMDVLLDAPLETVVSETGLPREVRDAVLVKEGPLGAVLALVEKYEEGEWETVEARAPEMGLDPYDLAGLYYEALQWARSHG